MAIIFNMKLYINGFKLFFKFNEHLTRSEFWFFVLFNYIALFLYTLIGGLTNFAQLGNIYFFISIIPLTSYAWRRVRDTGKNGLLCFMPIYNIILFCKESQRRSK